MEVNVVGRANQTRFRKIGALGEQRIEGVEIPVATMPVTARDICFQRDPRLPWSIRKGVALVGSGPSAKLAVLVSTGFTVNKSMSEVPTREISFTPSKLCRTFGDSRKEIRREEP